MVEIFLTLMRVHHQVAFPHSSKADGSANLAALDIYQDFSVAPGCKCVAPSTGNYSGADKNQLVRCSAMVTEFSIWT